MATLTISSIALTLFLVMDPFGNISSFLKLLDKNEREHYRLSVLREMLFVLAIILFFNVLGEYLLQLLQISPTTVYFSSSIILFLTAFQILFPTSKSLRHNLPEEHPILIPLAVPLIAGPSLLAMVMIFAHETTWLPMLISIFIAWLAALIVLLFGREIKKFIKENGLIALERLMGMVLILVAIQKFFEGVALFVESFKAVAS
ncbi:MarC family protein [Criblamydia sequanensis]|uniref:UPF0056 membrane protein n=1 Tax=Candidatus Criblamydia sequanensis CRIB-18 TaxID=1437425 RepID=A0A090E3G4_9BACT|nr:MarC family protein [Criblamydia sequanensis]CDR35124.1 Conserved putative membrane protein [Criblamydia sequanensis CRIB-18]